MPSPATTSGQGGPTLCDDSAHYTPSPDSHITTLMLGFWGKKFKNPTIVAHWKLAEACGLYGIKQGRSVHKRTALLSLQERVKQGETDVPWHVSQIRWDRKMECEALKHESANILLLHQPGRKSISGYCQQDYDSAMSEISSTQQHVIKHDNKADDIRHVLWTQVNLANM